MRKHGDRKKPYWATRASYALVASFFLLASVCSAISFVFHAWLASARPEHSALHSTLAMISMVATPVLFLATFIVPVLLRRKARGSQVSQHEPGARVRPR